jgi:hypothetical protein
MAVNESERREQESDARRREASLVNLPIGLLILIVIGLAVVTFWPT